MREAVGLFQDMDRMQEAIKELERTEFPRDSLSVIGHHDELVVKWGQLPPPSEYQAQDKSVEREEPVREEERTLGVGAMISGAAYVGAMAAALAGGAVTIPGIILAAAVGGTGGAAVAGVLAKVLGDKYDQSVEKQISEGGLLLWVRTPTPEKEKSACDILQRYGATNVNVQEF